MKLNSMPAMLLPEKIPKNGYRVLRISVKAQPSKYLNIDVLPEKTLLKGDLHGSS